MRQLLLLRHAKSPSDDPSLSDHARPLNAAGRQTVALMRATIAELGLLPELVLVSSARRTRQTLDALEPWPEERRPPQVRVLDSLYLASRDQLLAVLRQIGDMAERVMVIGHNPGLHELALHLLGDTETDADVPGGAGADRLAHDFPTGALAEFALAADWAALRPGATVRLVQFLCPRDLPEMAG